MNLSRILTAITLADTEITHLELNTSLNQDRKSIVYTCKGERGDRAITKDRLIFHIIDWAFNNGYMLSLYRDTDGSFEERDYTCSVFLPQSYDIDFTSDNFFDAVIKATLHIIEERSL